VFLRTACESQREFPDFPEMSTKQFSIQVDEKVISGLEDVCVGAHMRHTAYAGLILARFAELRPEFALDALTAIPKEFFRRGPGRPPSAARGPAVDSPAFAQNPG
jgi:hypothetical protein